MSSKNLGPTVAGGSGRSSATLERWLSTSPQRRLQAAVALPLDVTSSDLHLSHWFHFAAMDSWCRVQRMKGFSVLQPIVFNTFGLKTLYEARCAGVAPQRFVDENIRSVLGQLSELGYPIDSGPIVDPRGVSFWRNTQALFLRLREAGLVTEATRDVSWCPGCSEVLTPGEEVDTSERRNSVRVGHCKFCKGALSTRPARLWFLRVEPLRDDLRLRLDDLDWSCGVVAAQHTRLSAPIDDWPVSRQSAWGVPLPLMHCRRCGQVPVPIDQLPFPAVSGRTCACPTCGADARPVSGVLDSYFSACWPSLTLPYAGDPDHIVDWRSVNAFSIDAYVGCSKGALTHYLYTRILAATLHRLGSVPGAEPLERLVCGGGLHGLNREKLPRSLPARLHAQFGTDVVRLALLGGIDYRAGGPWCDAHVERARRLLGKLEEGIQRAAGSRTAADAAEPSDPELSVEPMQRLMRASDDFRFLEVTQHLESLVARLGTLGSNDCRLAELLHRCVVLIAPICPHAGAAFWLRLGHTRSLFDSPLAARIWQISHVHGR